MNIFDFAKGWHYNDFFSDPQRHVPGLLTSSVPSLFQKRFKRTRGGKILRIKGAKLPSAHEVISAMWEDTEPLSWFLVYEMLIGRHGASSPQALSLVRGEVTDANLSSPILPRYVLTLHVEVGTPPVQGPASQDLDPDRRAGGDEERVPR